MNVPSVRIVAVYDGCVLGECRLVIASAAAVRRILLFNIVISFNRPDRSDPVHGA